MRGVMLSGLRVVAVVLWMAALGLGPAAVRACRAWRRPLLMPTETGEQLFDGFAPAGGVGLRVLFSKRTSTNLCIDYAWGRQGAKGFCLGLQEAF